jgi:hypothetical protein
MRDFSSSRVSRQISALDIVELENGHRALSRLLIVDLKIGMAFLVKVDIVREKPGKNVYGFRFDVPGSLILREDEHAFWNSTCRR